MRIHDLTDLERFPFVNGDALSSNEKNPYPNDNMTRWIWRECPNGLKHVISGDQSLTGMIFMRFKNPSPMLSLVTPWIWFMAT